MRLYTSFDSRYSASMQEQTPPAPSHSEQTDVALPLFFKSPHAIGVERHVQAGLHRHTNYYFAKDATSIPLSYTEAVEACHSYPIVFTRNNPPGLLALTGLKQRNLFIDKQGQWEPHGYVPIYVQKYPFGIVELKQEEREEYILCVDEGAEHFAPKQPDLPFYAPDEAPSDVCQEALQYCGEYQKQIEATTEFIYALMSSGIITPRDIPLSIGPQQLTITGVSFIEEEAFQNLPAELLADWHKKGWLGIVYAILFSQQRWLYLVEEEKRRLFA